MSQRSTLLSRLASRLSVTLAVLAACSEDPAAPGTGGPPPVSPALVSAPVLGVPGVAGLRLAVAYVSMRPGTDPVGVSVTVRNGQVGLPVDAAMADGGFDPIAIAAEAGDTLRITVHRSDGTSAPGYGVVRTRTRPAVVRTSPAHYKTDVVLNSIITVIFTQPMDSASLSGALHLRVAGAEVAGTVTVSAGAGKLLSAVFVPASSLAPGTTYQFEVSTAALGQNGEPLATPVQVTFTTGLTAGVVATVFMTPLSLVVGGQSFVHTVPLDASGTRVVVGCAWGTSDAAVATIITSTGELSALTPGTTVIRATCGAVFGEATATVVPIPSGLVFASVSVGGWHSCGVTTGGVAYCWGDNHADALGDGVDWGMGYSATPVPVTGGLTFAAVSGAWNHTCGVTTGGAAYCWGDNRLGVLGTGDTTDYWTGPIAVVGGLTFASVSTGLNHTCGVTTGGLAYCWGRGENLGELGNGTTTGSTTPVAVAGGLTFVTLSASGWSHSCGLTTTGTAYCWGSNFFGELGDGTTTGSSVPVAVVGGLTFAQVSAGDGHTCGVTTSGAAYCWGWNGIGQLGTGDTTSSALPVAVVGGLTFAMVSAGDRYNCGVTTGGAAYCWGYAPGGHLGDGDGTGYDYRPTPVAVAGGLTFASVDAGDGQGYDHTCGVTTTGVAYCWGWDTRGQLGDGGVVPYPDFGPPSHVPVKVVYQP
jgi:alpha-tubulin suppressor-like RCC1 family protein